MSILIKQNKGAFITLLRLFMSEITLKKFCMKNKLSVGLTGIIEFIIKQTIIFNSYKTSDKKSKGKTERRDSMDNIKRVCASESNICE